MTGEQLAALAEQHTIGSYDDPQNKRPVWKFQIEQLHALLQAACPEKDLDTSGLPMTDATYNAVHKVYLRAGMLAMRQLICEAEDATIEEIWPAELCPDPGKPRLLEFSELATGPEDGPWQAVAVAPEVEALPIAHGLIEAVRRERLAK